MTILRCALMPLLILAFTPIGVGESRSLQSVNQRGPMIDDDPPEGYLPRLSAANGELCVKQCPLDDLPCDPPSFKVADGRCSMQWR